MSFRLGRCYVGTHYNRSCFCKHANNALTHCTPAGKLTILDLQSILQFICPDFPLGLVKNAFTPALKLTHGANLLLCTTTISFDACKHLVCVIKLDLASRRTPAAAPYRCFWLRRWLSSGVSQGEGQAASNGLTHSLCRMFPCYVSLRTAFDGHQENML
jgi:hypothetical protein